MKTFLIKSSFITGLLGFACAGYSDTLLLKDGREIVGQYEGGSSRHIRFRTNAGITEHDLLDVSRIRISGTASSARNELAGSAFGDGNSRAPAFGPGQERIIRNWFADSSNLEGLPPGLARRSSLPPGLARQVRRNGTLPPGLQRRVQPLPLALERQLPALLGGIERVVLGRDVLLLDSASSRIVDLLRNVL